MLRPILGSLFSVVFQNESEVILDNRMGTHVDVRERFSGLMIFGVQITGCVTSDRSDLFDI